MTIVKYRCATCAPGTCKDQRSNQRKMFARLLELESSGLLETETMDKLLAEANLTRDVLARPAWCLQTSRVHIGGLYDDNGEWLGV